MISTDMGQALPLHGAAGQLLAAAIASPSAQSLTRLGEDAGLSKYAASRAGQQLQEAGLLVPAPRGYCFNAEHELAELAMTVVRVLTGSTPYVPPQLSDISSDRSDDMSYLNDLPADLRLPGPLTADRDPSPVTAVQGRVVLELLSDLMRRVLEPEEIAQAMYAQWGSQRAPDMVHQTLHLGNATGAARSTLAAETSARRPGGHTHVSTWAWTRATCLVRAEQRRLERTAELFEKAIKFGGTFHGRREQLLDEITLIARRQELDREDQLRRITDRYAEIQQLWKDTTGALHHIGGMPGPADVGATGDQFLAVILQNLTSRYAALGQRMDDLAAGPRSHALDRVPGSAASGTTRNSSQSPSDQGWLA